MPALLMSTSSAPDLARRLLDLRNVGHVERDGRDAFVRVLDCPARCRIYSRRASPECLIDERLADAAVGAGDQNGLIRDVHVVLLFEIRPSVRYYAGRRTED